MDVVLNSVHALTVQCSVHQGTIIGWIPWIESAPNLQVFSLAVSNLDSENQGVQWEPLILALEHATHVKEVVVLKYKELQREFDRTPTPEDMQCLKALVPRHVSVFLQTRSGNECRVSLKEIL